MKVEEIAHKAGKTLHLPRLVREEKRLVKKILNRVVYTREKVTHHIDENDIFKVPMPPKEGCKCCKGYIKKTQTEINKLIKKITVLKTLNL